MLVGGGHSGHRTAAGLVRAHDRAEVRVEVGVRDVRVGVALDRVGDVGRRHFPIHRRAEVNPLADVNSERLAVGRDLRRARGHVRTRRAERIRPVGVQGTLDSIEHLVVEREVGRAGVEVFEVLVVEHGERAPSLAPRLRLGRRGLHPAYDLQTGAAGDRVAAGAARGQPYGERCERRRRDRLDQPHRHSSCACFDPVHYGDSWLEASRWILLISRSSG